ncbi:hypothetical protein SFC76_03085 [Sphingomonas sp. CD22]|uniref:hypothetical protein n=1 Tax=Sphingomonas sp. CD22 TaxID=3100214 RepID=UPI002ADF2F15|nr:hypothetical protein [Sphingomonas sp. CD22]MEA1083233.1 hypothetical protein [Sphingomonas sp. CD22]
MGRPAHRAAIGEPSANTPVLDVLRENAARLGCLALLQAQLRAGAHILPLPLARKLGATIGLHRDEVRPAVKSKASAI